MKFQLAFKTPDVLDQLEEIENEEERETVKCLAKKFLQFQEILIVELDTEKQTATVME